METVITSGPSSPMMSGNALFKFGVVKSPDFGSAVYYTSLSTPAKNGPWEQVDGDTKVYYDLSSGIYALRVYAVDGVGNQDPTPSVYTWSVYGEEVYTEYMQVVGFKTVDRTPITYKAKSLEYAHDSTASSDV